MEKKELSQEQIDAISAGTSLENAAVVAIYGAIAGGGMTIKSDDVLILARQLGYNISEADADYFYKVALAK